MNARLKYLSSCAGKFRDKPRLNCPSCGNSTSEIVQRKFLVTALRRCSACRLQFRTPTTTPEENASFYQSDYKQGFTSDLPDDATLKELLDAKFQGLKKDAEPYLKMLEALGRKPGMKLFDFGCSWGYGSWQFRERGGYNVTSFEISKPRCRFAREKLGINAYESLDDVPGEDFDIFFSGHVIEHVPSVESALEYARRKLKPGGLFIAYTPNGSNDRRQKDPAAWGRNWGMVHPNSLDDVYYKHRLPGVFLATPPYDFAAIASAWEAGKTGVGAKFEGPELMAAIKF
ncbi:MAG: class I SAM-dependent methyltransferase [Verrucomicrobiaceae bacterium]|nr:MAG: class I SAM-dependent methyltransferase [Verrucomicrobiaceae bacterium]